MRQDQFEKMQALEEKLLDVFIAEADPEHWPGKGLALGAMDAKTRGDLYWVRKTAASALLLATRVQQSIGAVIRGGAGTAPPDGEQPTDAQQAHQDQQVDAEYAAAEREAERLMRELQTGAGKKAFDRKAHGKA